MNNSNSTHSWRGARPSPFLTNKPVADQIGDFVADTDNRTAKAALEADALEARRDELNSQFAGPGANAPSTQVKNYAGRIILPNGTTISDPSISNGNAFTTTYDTRNPFSSLTGENPGIAMNQPEIWSSGYSCLRFNISFMGRNENATSFTKFGGLMQMVGGAAGYWASGEATFWGGFFAPETGGASLALTATGLWGQTASLDQIRTGWLTYSTAKPQRSILGEGLFQNTFGLSPTFSEFAASGSTLSPNLLQGGAKLLSQSQLAGRFIFNSSSANIERNVIADYLLSESTLSSELAVRTQPLVKTPLTANSIMLDNNIASVVSRTRAGLDPKKLQSGAETNTLPKLAELAQSGLTDYRISDTVKIELKTTEYLNKGFNLTADRDSEAYQRILKILTKDNVGSGGGTADRLVVADAFFAEGESRTLITADRKIYNKLYKHNDNGTTLVGHGGKRLPDIYPNGFNITIDNRKLKVIPISGLTE